VYRLESPAEFPNELKVRGNGKVKVRSHLTGAAGVVLVKFNPICLTNTTPSARAKVASQLFVDRAATPPQLRRGLFSCPCRSRVPLLVVRTTIAMFLAFAPFSMTAQTAEPTSVAAPADLDRRIDEVIHERKYAWRMPRVPGQQKEQGLIVRFLTAVGNMLSRMIGRVVDWIDELLKWLFPNSRPRSPFFGSLVSSQGLLYLLLAIVLSALAVFLIRVRNKRRKGTALPPVSLEAIPNVADESTAADQLPEHGWSKLGRELIERGEYRLAMRAFYLASLVRLSQQQLIAIARFKSNRDYENELSRRAHSYPNLRQRFSDNLRIYERVWYGDHAADRELADQFAASAESIRADA